MILVQDQAPIAYLIPRISLVAILLAGSTLPAMDGKGKGMAQTQAKAKAEASAQGASSSSSSSSYPSAVQDFRTYVIRAMDRIEAARRGGFVLYPADYLQKHGDRRFDDHESMMLCYGLTSHSGLFEQYHNETNPLLTFRLKPRVSASAALDTLLTSGETVLDCSSVSGLAYMLAARMSFEARHGEARGRLRFDCLWGSAHVEVPTVQRLLITNNSMVAGTEGYLEAVDGNINPLNPFAFFVQFSSLAETAAHAGTLSGKRERSMKAQVKPGSMLGFFGHPRYLDKHPSGSEGSYSTIVAGADDGHLVLRFFGDEGRAMAEKDLVQRHVAAYNLDGDGAVNALAKASMKDVESGFPDRVDAKGVPGISLASHMDLVEARWLRVLDEPLSTLVPSYRSYLNEQLKGRLGLLPEDRMLPETQANRRIYAFPAATVADKGKLMSLLNLGARVVGKTGTFTRLELESAALTKALREEMGLERRGLKALGERARAELAKIPEATLEPDLQDDRFLITLPKESFHKVEAILAS